MTPRVTGALLLVLCALLVPPLAAGSAPGATPPQQATETPTPVPENTTFAVQIQRTGDAVWTITDTYALEGDNETRAFRDTGEAFASGDDDVWLPAFQRANEAASDATGREMAITDVERRYEVSDRKGQLVLQFTWTNFATVDGENIVVGDAFNSTDGTWLGTLTADQRLIISPPAGYGVESAPSAVTDGKLIFDGERTFEPGYLSVVYTGEQAVTPTPTETPGSVLGSLGSLWVGGLVLAVVVVAVAGYLVTGRSPDGLPSVSVGGADSETVNSDGGTAGAAGGEEADEVDLELLSDEERVERLLEQNGGRMKQARIVTETGWSNAKVSQLLSSMDEEGRIDKLRIGRENLISFPDEDITEFDDS